MKVLEIKFTGAKLYYNECNGKFKKTTNYDQYGKPVETEWTEIQNPINRLMVLNIIHVLCNIPPVPQNRDSAFVYNQFILDNVGEALVRYDTVHNLNGKPIFEFCNGIKCAENTNRKTSTNGLLGIWDWQTTKKFIGKARYDYLLTLVEEKGNFLEEVKHLNIEDFPEKYFVGITPFYNLINTHGKVAGENNGYFKPSVLLNISAVAMRSNMINGELLIKISDELAECFEKTCCTILDGGFGEITILDSIEYDLEELKAFNTIE